MAFVEKRKLGRIQKKPLRVKGEEARVSARFSLLSSIASRTKGTEGWEKSRIYSKPRTIYDLSGLPLFHDFMVYRGRFRQGNIRIGANKTLGNPIISTQINPEGWSVDKANLELGKLVKRKYRDYALRSRRLVCYSYPKLAFLATLLSRDRKTRQILMDVGDFTEIALKPGPGKDRLGQIPYSILGAIPEQKEQENIALWNKAEKNMKDVIAGARRLEPSTFYKLTSTERLKAIDSSLAIIKPVTERTLDYCCHVGDCRDHACFCLHPQENSVHCARASGQMMLCYWRYCYSQHDIAQAYGVSDTVGTPVSAVVPGLESLTNNCFDATLNWSVTWTNCENEIVGRRPFMSCVWGHARACAGTQKWNIWIINTPRPRYLKIYDPWPPNTGAIYWENFNTTNYLCMFTLARKTTTHP